MELTTRFSWFKWNLMACKICKICGPWKPSSRDVFNGPWKFSHYFHDLFTAFLWSMKFDFFLLWWGKSLLLHTMKSPLIIHLIIKEQTYQKFLSFSGSVIYRYVCKVSPLYDSKWLWHYAQKSRNKCKNWLSKIYS